MTIYNPLTSLNSETDVISSTYIEACTTTGESIEIKFYLILFQEQSKQTFTLWSDVFIIADIID